MFKYCSNSLNNDYKITHEKNEHDGKHPNIKIVGAAANPFTARTLNQRFSIGGSIGKVGRKLTKFIKNW